MIYKAIRRAYDVLKPSAVVEVVRGRLRSADVVDGYGLAVHPSAGVVDAVVLQYGQKNMVIKWNDAGRPSDLAEGEVRLYAHTGAGQSKITLKADGSILIEPANGVVNIVADVNITGDLSVGGDTSTQAMDAATRASIGGIEFGTHTHVDSQGGTTGVPQ